MDVYIDGQRIRLDPSASIGKGGEADVFKLGNGMVVKVFKQPNHPDFAGDPHGQEGARLRLEEHQRKLKEFPRPFPPHVVVPQKLATDKTGSRILGYTMPMVLNAEVLLRYADIQWRESGGIVPSMITEIFRDLAKTVTLTHNAHVVIGDFNDLNVLVSNTDAFIIDADSMQFGSFLCRVFTTRFVDPLLCDPKRRSPSLVRVYTPDSDWYAYAVMLMQCLLFAGPYAGVYRPKRATDRIDHDARPLHRITVFNPEVRRPKVMLNPDILPDDLLQYLHLIFERDRRGSFPTALLDQLRWTTCPTCKTVHARSVCPVCRIAPPAAVREVVQVRGMVTATRTFHTSGIVLHAAIQSGKLRWLYHANDAFRREDNSVVLNGALDQQMRFRIRGVSTVVGKSGQMATLTPGQQPELTAVDSYGQLPVFDTTEDTTYWVSDGRLQCTDTLGPKHIGDVLGGQTLIWVGPTFGFGLYRAGQMQVAFVFDVNVRGINDTVKLPTLGGHLVDATCAFSRDYCWLLTSVHAGGITVNHCMVIDRHGVVLATAQTPEGDDTWLGTVRGKTATGDSLLTATDSGIVRVRPDGTAIVVAQEFPDTEPFVSAHVHLHAAREGLYAVGRNDITLLQIRTT